MKVKGVKYEGLRLEEDRKWTRVCRKYDQICLLPTSSSISQRMGHEQIVLDTLALLEYYFGKPIKRVKSSKVAMLQNVSTILILPKVLKVLKVSQ